MAKHGDLLCSFSFATTRWHFRFSPVYDVFVYERALAVVLTSSKPAFAAAVREGKGLTPKGSAWDLHEARMREKGQLDVDGLVAQDQGNRLVAWSDVVSGRLHKRRLGISRLVLNLRDGSTLKLIWMPRGPWSKVNGPLSEVAHALRRALGARVRAE